MNQSDFDQLKCDIQVIDEQHGNLISLLELYELHHDDALFEVLENEWNTHAITEEILMCNADYPKFVDHMAQHHGVIPELVGLLKLGDINRCKEIVIAHIITWDKPMANWLKSQQGI